MKNGRKVGKPRNSRKLVADQSAAANEEFAGANKMVRGGGIVPGMCMEECMQGSAGADLGFAGAKTFASANSMFAAVNLKFC